jgi:hypothetical protein
MPIGGINSSKQWWVGNNPITGKKGTVTPPFQKVPTPGVGIMPISPTPGKKPRREFGINPPPATRPPSAKPKPPREMKKG